MKKFISMVMAAAMVVSLVPATAFAASGTASFDVAGAKEWKEANVGTGSLEGVQIQLEVTGVTGTIGKVDSFDIALDFDGAEVNRYRAEGDWTASALGGNGAIVSRTDVTAAGLKEQKLNATAVMGEIEDGDTYVEIKITEAAGQDLAVGDTIILQLGSFFVMSDTDEGNVAYVTVGGDFGDSEPMVIGSVLGEALKVTVSGKPVEVAEEEIVELKGITIESKVGSFTASDEVKVKINKGFEFINVTNNSAVLADGPDDNNVDGAITAKKADGTDVAGVKVLDKSVEEDEFIITGLDGVKKIFINELVVEAVSANAGDVASIIVSAKGYEGAEDEAVKVIEDAVVMSVDEDEDVPVMYSGVNAAEDGLQTNADHKALKVTIEETVADAWDTVEKWTLSLPEGVYVVADNTTVSDNGNITWKGFTGTDAEDKAFAAAYKEGDYENFEFGRRSFEVAANKKAKIEFVLELVAEPEFEGPVTLTLSGEGFDGEAEVVIAEFVKPYTVEAAQNDLVIDYKETLVPTAVTITEAEMGLWDDNTTTGANFAFYVEDIFVEDSNVAVDEESDMSIDDLKWSDAGFVVDEESDECAATVTIDGIELYMERSIPAGAYDLEMTSNLFDGFLQETVFGFTGDKSFTTNNGVVTAVDGSIAWIHYDKDTTYFETVKEGFVNVITAGRDKDDASFTKKVVVPVGEAYIIAGEEKVALDVPAYINAAGYTMLPVRAVATALGIDNNNVLWSQAAKQVTILYGQRIITMTVGQSVIYVNGSAIPASAAVEVVDGRAFLGLRDLANALGVTDIAYDAATKTATLN